MFTVFIYIYMHARYVALDEEFVGPRRACFSIIIYCLWRIVVWASVLDAVIPCVTLWDAMSIGVGVRRRIGGLHCKWQC